MDRNHSTSRYHSRYIEDNKDGFAAYVLTRTRDGESKDVAQVTFWDANGQFFIETFGEDVPLEVARELIAEAEQNIRVR